MHLILFDIDGKLVDSDEFDSGAGIEAAIQAQHPAFRGVGPEIVANGRADACFALRDQGNKLWFFL